MLALIIEQTATLSESWYCFDPLKLTDMAASLTRQDASAVLLPHMQLVYVE
jgi:hypothetical protein